MWFYIMKILFAYFYDIIIQHHSISLLRLVLIWSKILLHIWYQSIMIVFGLKIAAEYHNHYLTVNQKAAYQSTSDINWLILVFSTSHFLHYSCLQCGNGAIRTFDLEEKAKKKKIKKYTEKEIQSRKFRAMISKNKRGCRK